jgi:stearoyl-CoA desaturase (delta-9 desaturase)
MLAAVLVFIFSYFWHGFGVTIGYHRLITHHSFRCPKWIEYAFVLPGYLAFEGTPIWWAAIHRAHHRHSDTDLDPHSPRHGKRWAYFGWIFKPDPAYLNLRADCPDLYKDKLYAFMQRGDDPLMLAVNLAFRGLLWLLFGWQVALASLMAGLVVLQMPLILNTVCHLPGQGYKTYDTKDDGVNVWWLGYLVGGEGWHNNHHAFPGSARQGFKASEYDLSWELIKILKMIGLATNVNLPPPDKIIEYKP